MELSVYDSTFVIKYSLIKIIRIPLSDIISRQFYDSKQQVSFKYNSGTNDKIIYLQYSDIKQPHTVSFDDFKTWFDGNVMGGGGSGGGGLRAYWRGVWLLSRTTCCKA